MQTTLPLSLFFSLLMKMASSRFHLITQWSMCYSLFFHSRYALHLIAIIVHHHKHNKNTQQTTTITTTMSTRSATVTVNLPGFFLNCLTTIACRKLLAQVIQHDGGNNTCIYKLHFSFWISFLFHCAIIYFCFVFLISYLWECVISFFT